MINRTGHLRPRRVSRILGVCSPTSASSSMRRRTQWRCTRGRRIGSSSGARSMLPIGAVSSPKGAMLALMVELLVTALTGAQFGFEASSFFVDAGNAPRIGQAFIVIDPGALAGSDAYFERMETVIGEMLVDDGVRLAGERRLALERKARLEGLELPDAVVLSLRA